MPWGQKYSEMKSDSCRLKLGFVYGHPGNFQKRNNDVMVGCLFLLADAPCGLPCGKARRDVG